MDGDVAVEPRSSPRALVRSRSSLLTSSLLPRPALVHLLLFACSGSLIKQQEEYVKLYGTTLLDAGLPEPAAAAAEPKKKRD